MTDLLLDREQLQRLTGKKQVKRMVKWLRDKGYPFEPPERRGELPRVSVDYVRRRLAGDVTTPSAPQRPRVNTDWMRRAA